MNPLHLTATSKEVLDPGFRQIFTPPGQAPLPASQSAIARLKKGQRVHPRTVHVRRNPPPPPPMMHEAALIQALRTHKIGRPATYALIIETLLARRYVIREETGQLHTTPRGREVCAFLVQHFPTLCAYEFTSQMETALDEIAHGRRTYREVVGEMWNALPQETPAEKPPHTFGAEE